MEKKIGSVTVNSRKWEKGSKRRIYFSAGQQGQACWDLVNEEWITVHGEFGARFKAHIKSAFEL